MTFQNVSPRSQILTLRFRVSIASRALFQSQKNRSTRFDYYDTVRYNQGYDPIQSNPIQSNPIQSNTEQYIVTLYSTYVHILRRKEPNEVADNISTCTSKEKEHNSNNNT